MRDTRSLYKSVMKDGKSYRIELAPASGTSGYGGAHNEIYSYHVFVNERFAGKTLFMGGDQDQNEYNAKEAIRQAISVYESATQGFLESWDGNLDKFVKGEEESS